MKKKILSCFLLLLSVLGEYLSVAQRVVATIGPDELKRTRAMNEALLLKSAIGDMLTHNQIGGILFEKVGVPTDSLVSHQKITLKYQPAKNDGYRLQVSTGASKDSIYYPYIPDWQLRPIAEFADGDNTAVFSYFNPNDSRNNHTVRYHPAFMDGLLGYRLFQADLIFRGPHMAGLPRDAGTGKLMIAESEKKFKLDTTSLLFLNLQNDLYEAYPGYDSYIITDWGKEIRFGVMNDSFYLSGEPFYLFTTTTGDSTQLLFQLSRKLSAINTAFPFENNEYYKSIKKLCQKPKITNADLDSILTWLSDLSEKYEYPYSTWFSSKSIGFYYREDSAEFIHSLKKDIFTWEHLLKDTFFLQLKNVVSQGNYSWSLKEASDYLGELYLKYNSSAIIFLSAYLLSSEENDVFSDWNLPEDATKVTLLLKDSYTTNQFTKKIFDFNPVVFNSCTVTARYAAFFRYIKANNPLAWQQFIKSIRNNKPAQTDFSLDVKTPDSIE